MADTTAVVHIGENSPEEVAYKLLHDIGYAEGKRFTHGTNNPATVDRQWLLSTYAECLRTVRDPFGRRQ
jgi:hypothetical protein